VRPRFDRQSKAQVTSLHRQTNYIECASNGNRDLDSLTTAALAAAEELNASREQKSEVIILPDIGSARLSLHDMRSAGAHSNVGLPSVV
jgi:dihydroxyacetone kinase DhaKLM complex PTS-EIIA-like component DhaM